MKRAELYVGARWLPLAMISGCTENPVKPTTGNLLASISDGARDANGIAGFYFRPPILPDIAYSGTFDATLSPEVVICEWANSCVTEIARYTMTTGTGGEAIVIEAGDAPGVCATIYALHEAPVPDATPGWSIQSTSGAPANATFGSGTLTAVSPGNGTLTAAYRGRSASALYTIYEPPVSLAFATSCGSLAIGSSVTIIATAFDAAHQPITRTLRTHYSSSDDAIAVVDPSAGVLGGMGRGLATIGASLLGSSTVTRGLVFNSRHAIT